MKSGVKTLYVKDRKVWRSWLAKNGHRVDEIWLIYPRKHSGKVRIPYDHAVEEALCFGWIDGLTGKLDADHYVQRFTPRRPSSRWSAINIKRARKLIVARRMTAAGLEAFRPERKTEDHPTELPVNLQEMFQQRTRAWKNFQAFPAFYRRMSIAWVASAKKEETRLRRLNRLLDFSARNERIKFV
ncbi:MAG TPA: YdeI/OmpD-associated family protein [Terriglobales bacterium]|nr:YdeI/OmpD-associated family protein [Terriglobales bacterium]